jgi:hypothetical protein
MSTYIEMRTDGFKRNLDDLVERRALDFEGVRRPLRGIEIKEDTYSIIKVIRSDGKEVPLVDSGSKLTANSLGIRGDSQIFPDAPPEGSTFNYSNFIAQQVIDARTEKSQVVENFGEPYIFFYGEKPRIMQVQGLLMNTLDFNWKNEFWKNYENYLRGTKLVELDARIYFYFDDQIVEGYMLDASASHSADMPYHVPFQFTIFVTGHTYIGLLSSSSDYPISANLNLQATEQIDLLSQEVVGKLRDRKDALRPNQLLSTTWRVRQAAERAAGELVGKEAIQSAIIKGLSSYEAKTRAFFDNVKSYFYGRRMVVPKGIAGAELLAGQATYADAATFPGVAPQRQLPLRSKITDNVDEYIGGSLQQLPKGLMEDAIDINEIYEEDLEQKLLLELARLGVDVSKPNKMQNWRSNFTHTITKTADRIDFAQGIAIHGTGSIVNKSYQMFDLAKSLPGTLISATAGAVSTATPPLPVKPPFIP